MLADIFYKTKSNNNTKIILIEDDDFNDLSFDKRTTEIFKKNDFYGKAGGLILVMNQEGMLDKIYVGVNKQDDINCLAALVSKIPPGEYVVENLPSEKAILNWSLEQYTYDEFKKSSFEPRVLILPDSTYKKVLTTAQAIFLTRDLINKPTNILGPKELSNIVKDLALEHNAAFEELTGDELLHNNYPAIHTVGRAAASEPRLLMLNWGNIKNPKITLVGKGVCFDSGGLDIKPSSGMRLMKKDMGGAAHAIGLAKLIMTEKLPINLQIIIPAVENSVSCNSYRPGDVLIMRNGMSVEIDNTDAEGRLILADALVRACEDKPELIIDFATLTGAARIAVGTEIAAMFCNDDKLADDIQKSGVNTNDPVWRMPLFSPYKDMFESKIADMTNCASSSYAGAITAALFLEYYVSKKIKWAHFDVMAWNINKRIGRPIGGEAMGVVAVWNYLKNKYNY